MPLFSLKQFVVGHCVFNCLPSVVFFTVSSFSAQLIMVIWPGPSIISQDVVSVK